MHIYKIIDETHYGNKASLKFVVRNGEGLNSSVKIDDRIYGSWRVDDQALLVWRSV